MGTGAFSNGKFNFVIVALHEWDAAEKADWQARFIEASHTLYEASEGQLSFGKIFMVDEGWGLGHAEFVVHSVPSTAYATNGGYGTLGLSVQLFSDQRTGDPKTIVHEFGHHAFRLGDEYTGPVQQDEIDTTVTPPSYNGDPPFYNVVPLHPSENDSQSLQSGFAVLRFDGVVERLIVEEHHSGEDDDAPAQVTVYSAFTQNPHEADGGRIFYQPQYNYTPEFPDGIQIRCRGIGVQNANYCLMERYKDPSEDVTEFCSEDNHDPNQDTSHSAQHGGLSCWEVIQTEMQERYGFQLEVPNPAEPGHQTDGYPLFLDLAKEARIALVMDRSGSMNQNNKIQGARFGIEQWINIAHYDNDWLSVIWFNQDFDTRLSLSQIDQTQIDSIINQVNDVNGGGWTNIRDSLLEAVHQIQSRDTDHGPAALQAIVLLTDGIHNRPVNSSTDEVIPTLQEAGIPVYVIALGTPEEVDYDALEKLARETGGIINPVGLIEDDNGNPLPPAAQNAAIAIHIDHMNNILRNGLVTVGDQTVAGAPPDSKFGDAIAETRGSRLTLEELARLEDLNDISSFVKKHTHTYSFTVPFLVEEGASNARFTITYEQKQKFNLHLIDPEGNLVDFTASSDAVLIEPESPYETAMVRNPKSGQWHAVIARASTGSATRVNYSAGVENRMIVAHADCDRDVPVGMPASISASAIWRDQLSGLSVTARLTGPDGSIHNIVLSDETYEEPDSGDYRGVFTPELPGRYEGEVRIFSRGSAYNAGSIHRAVHAPQKNGEAAQFDLNSDAPVFVRRIPIYFDAGERPTPKDIEQPRSGRGERASVEKRKHRLKPLNVDRALKLVRDQ